MHLQVGELPGGGELEEKVGREALAVAPHLLVQACGRDTVERGELGIEQHLLAAQEEDRASDVLGSRHSLRAGQLPAAQRGSAPRGRPRFRAGGSSCRGICTARWRPEALRSDGATVVLEVAMKAAMAAAGTNRRRPITTLGSSPLLRRS